MAELDARRAAVLFYAANTIQRLMRTYIARKDFLKKRQAAIVVQSHCRGMLHLHWLQLLTHYYS